MSKFEFISVAQSLICSLIVARILSFFAGANLAERAYSVHTAWVAFCLLSATMNWWLFWSYVDVSWTYPLFVLSLSPAGFVYMMAATMTPSESTAVVSWRDYWYGNKNRFFAYGAGFCVALKASAHFLVEVPFLQPRTALLLVLAAVAGAGFASTSHRVHVLIAIVWALVFFALFVGLFPLDLRDYAR
jgi:hypothetical protein